MFGMKPAGFLAWSLVTLSGLPALAAGAVIRFDVPPTVAVKPVSDEPDSDHILECSIRISSLIVSPDSPPIDQWLVVCQPRDRGLAIVDYSPKTNTESDMEGPIEVKRTDESSASIGLSMDASYGHALARPPGRRPRNQEN